MPYGFEHMIFPWALAKVLEYFKKIKLRTIEWFFLLFGALFPDIDYFIQWTTKISIHRVFTHSLFMVVLGYFIVYLFVKVYKKFKNVEWNNKKMALLFSLGILSHIFLDMMTGKPGVQLFWPLDKWYYFFGILPEPFKSMPYSQRTVEALANALKWAIFDIGVGALWLFYLMYKNKLKEL